MNGFSTHALNETRIAPSVWATTLWCTSTAPYPRPWPIRSPTVAVTYINSAAFPKYSLGSGGDNLGLLFAAIRQLVFSSGCRWRARVMDLRISEHNAWKLDISQVVLHSPLAFNFSWVIYCDDKWKILSRSSGGGENLSMNSWGCENNNLSGGFTSLISHLSWSGGCAIAILQSLPLVSTSLRHIAAQVVRKFIQQGPSPIAWLKEKPRKMPSASSVI